MKPLCLVALLACAPCLSGCGARPLHAHWDGKAFSCPPNTDIWADESEALAGRKNFAYCVTSPAPTVDSDDLDEPEETPSQRDINEAIQTALDELRSIQGGSHGR